MEKMNSTRQRTLSKLLSGRPQAIAIITGSGKYPDIHGNLRFFKASRGVIVIAEITGLPRGDGDCDDPIFAFHIHGGSECSGNPADPFANAGMHYNPHECPHPYHAGDMPPLFGCDGYAFSAFLTNRFSLQEIIGKTVIIHSAPDDFTTQPAGNSGEKIACGRIFGAK